MLIRFLPRVAAQPRRAAAKTLFVYSPQQEDNHRSMHETHQNGEKLVRDLIPDIIRRSGKTPRTRIVRGSDHIRALLAKIVEEAHEAQDAPQDLLAEELADVLTAINDLCEIAGINRADLATHLANKRSLRGGFKQGIILEGVDD